HSSLVVSAGDRGAAEGTASGSVGCGKVTMDSRAAARCSAPCGLGFALRPVPVDGARQALVEWGVRGPAEELPRPGRVEAAARLPVGLARVPHDPAAEAAVVRDHGGEVADRDLVPGPEIDRLAPPE